MFRSIKGQLKEIINVRVKIIKDQQRLNEQTTFCYSQISKLFKEESFVPFTGWAISPETILHVLNDIFINKRKTILELGGGASTLYIAKMIQVMQLDATLITVESDKVWAEELMHQIRLHDLEKYVRIIYSPMIDAPSEICYKDQKKWYKLELVRKEFEDGKKIDLLLVDGPVGASTPFARFPAIPVLSEYFSEDYIIFLDDINRTDEKEIANQWKIKLNCHLDYYGRYGVLTKEQGFDTRPFQLPSSPI